MWEQFVGLLPPWLTIMCAALSVILPYASTKISSKLRQFGDPPWKKEE
ncbi:hypothetical protein [Paenibacillus sp. MBLB4367]